jgi:hypothetical protein
VPVPDGISASLPAPYTGLKHLTKKVQTEAEYAETKARFLAVIAGTGVWATIHRELGDLDRLGFDGGGPAQRDPDQYPRFPPVIHPALQTGVEALIVAAGAWLAA